MLFEEALKTELEAIAGLAGAVYFVNAPEGRKGNYAVLCAMTPEPEQSHDGFSPEAEQYCEVDVLGDYTLDVRKLALLAQAKIRSFCGREIGGPGGPFVQRVRLEFPERGAKYGLTAWERELKKYRETVIFRAFY